MKKIAFAVLMLAASNGFCQTSPKESDTLQSLLVEVRQLRVAIEAMTVASQRVQIALYSLQMQDGAVARSAQRVDQAHGLCKDKEEERQHTESEISKINNQLALETNDAKRAPELQEYMAQQKSALESQATEVQGCQAAEAEASSQLRNDQAKLTDLQDRIERLDKTLGQMGAAGK